MLAPKKYPGLLVTPADKEQALYKGLLGLGAQLSQGYTDKPTSFMGNLGQAGLGFQKGYGDQIALTKADQLQNMQAQSAQAQLAAQKMKIQAAADQKKAQEDYFNMLNPRTGTYSPNMMDSMEQTDDMGNVTNTMSQAEKDNLLFRATGPAFFEAQLKQRFPTPQTGRQAAGLQYEDRLIEIQKMPETTEKERKLKRQTMKGFLTSLKIAKPMDLGGTIGSVSPFGVEELTRKTLPPEKQPANIEAETKARKTAEQTAEAAGNAFKTLDKVRVSIGNMNDALAAIRKGAKTGPIMQFLPSLNRASVELDNIQNRMGLDVIGNVTFGALSKGELDLALSTAIPTGLKPKALEQWLIRKKNAQEKLAKYLEEAALYLSKDGNTLASWTELQQKNRKPVQNNSTSSKSNMTDEDLIKFYTRTGKI